MQLRTLQKTLIGLHECLGWKHKPNGLGWPWWKDKRLSQLDQSHRQNNLGKENSLQIIIGVLPDFVSLHQNDILPIRTNSSD